MSISGIAEKNWDSLSPENKGIILYQVFPGMSPAGIQELSKIKFDDLPGETVFHQKHIRGSLIMAATEQGFSAEEEQRIRDKMQSL